MNTQTNKTAKHRYELRVKSAFGLIEYIQIDANTRTQASANAVRLGWVVMDVNMIG